MNSVAIVCRLVRDPEMRTTAGGVSVANMRVAVDRAGDKDGDSYKAGFFTVNAFGRTADLVGQYLSKGREVGFTGRLKHHEWEAQDGTKRSEVQIDAFELTFVGKKSDNEDGGDGQSSFVPASADADFQGSDDDIPF